MAGNRLGSFRMATNGLGGQKKSETAIAATTVFCNAGSISETPLLSWKSSASELGLLEAARNGWSQMARNGLDSFWQGQARWLARN